jgi:phosphoribosyl 1,2-cyclic phosphodiesterase
MEVILWGVRGTAPVPGPGTVRYGGNTPCIEVLSAGGASLLLDAGTGLRSAGMEIIRKGTVPGSEIHLALSHTHWDHIEGFPLFAPLYVNDPEPCRLTVLGSADHLEAFLHAFASSRGRAFFPVSIGDMPGRVDTRVLEHRTAIADLQLETAPLPHPGGCTGYRVTERGSGAVFVYCTDTEHPERGLDEAVLRLARNADLFLYDATFTPEEYEAGKQGWGHSTWLHAAQTAQKAGVRRLLLFHHAPEHDDDALDAILNNARREFPATDLATEGHLYTFP